MGRKKGRATLDTSDFSVESMAKELNTKKKPPVLFLGSRTSSLFRNPPLVKVLLQNYTKRSYLIEQMTPIQRFHEWYRTLEEQFPSVSERHEILQTIFREKPVKGADLYVAELIKHKRFHCIITTNIGNELVPALLQSGIKDKAFEVIMPGSAKFTVPRMTINDLHNLIQAGDDVDASDIYTIVKASGDVGSMKYSICEYNIDSKEIFLDKYPELKACIEEIKEEDMLMVGFDYKWDRHILHTIFPRRVESLWYVNEEQTNKDSQLFFYLKACKAKCLEGTTGGYELFFWNLCALTLGRMPPEQRQQTLESIDEMLSEMRGIKEEIKKLNKKVDILLKQSTAHPLSHTHAKNNSPPPSINSPSTVPEEDRDTLKKLQQFEEN